MSIRALSPAEAQAELVRIRATAAVDPEAARDAADDALAGLLLYAGREYDPAMFDALIAWYHVPRLCGGHDG